jgi:ABC-2 type transport system ATP-binding protein
MALVIASGLSKRFGDKDAVRDVSFRVEPGRVTGFLGPNRAGKCTTMRLMLGLDRGAGETLFDGRRYEQLRTPVARVGVVLDARSFHPRRTARDHLLMIARGSRIAPRRVDEVLVVVGLATVAGPGSAPSCA